MEKITAAQADAMFTKWRLSKTELSFQQYFELTKEDYLTIINILKEDGEL